MKTWMCALMLALSTGASAQNPIISGQYSADPTARVFNGKVYLYPSHDIPSPIEKLKEWFCMADYHVFSSSNLTEWQDHGVIVSQDKVPWVQDGSYTMWAPDCVEKDGKYYFYFPAAPKGEEKGFGIGVAVADHPEGPFMPMWKPIEGVHGIDPCVLIDKDGQAYLYWAGAGLHMAKLKPNMTELASEPKLVEGLPEGFKEGPFAFERNGKYYFTFPWVREKDGTETLAYAMADHPMGPFTFKGIIMDESPTKCWTNHHSIVEYQGQWYLFYHHNDYSPKFDKNRSVRIDSLNFNPNDATELSYFGRLSYSYDNRYFLQFNFRRDAFDSSKLSKDARWGNFPSVSAGWSISNEKFFKDHISRDAVSFLKLRGSWGKNGNVNVLSGYKYASPIAMNQSFYQYNPSVGDGKLSYGSKPTGLANPDLTWETSEQVDLGLDARFLNDRLTFSLDWYRKNTKDLLVEINPLPEIGVSKYTVNSGKVLNTGFDFELGWKDHINDFKYSVSFNGSTLKNEVKDLTSFISRIEGIGITFCIVPSGLKFRESIRTERFLSNLGE
jgi:hypothetical protein